jgi:hypothetical protein
MLPRQDVFGGGAVFPPYHGEPVTRATSPLPLLLFLSEFLRDAQLQVGDGHVLGVAGLLCSLSGQQVRSLVARGPLVAFDPYSAVLPWPRSSHTLFLMFREVVSPGPALVWLAREMALVESEWIVMCRLSRVRESGIPLIIAFS